MRFDFCNYFEFLRILNSLFINIIFNSCSFTLVDIHLTKDKFKSIFVFLGDLIYFLLYCLIYKTVDCSMTCSCTC